MVIHVKTSVRSQLKVRMDGELDAAVRQYCAAHNIPYASVSLPKSYAIIVRHLNSVGRPDRDLFACPVTAAYRV